MPSLPRRRPAFRARPRRPDRRTCGTTLRRGDPRHRRCDCSRARRRSREGEFAPLEPRSATGRRAWNDGRRDHACGLPRGLSRVRRGRLDGTLAAPVEAGGQGLPPALSAAVMEDLNAANVGVRAVPDARPRARSRRSKRTARTSSSATICRRSSAASGPATMNLTEPQAGCDVGALRTRAEPTATAAGAINGTKIFITYGEHDLTDNIVHLVLARTPARRRGRRAFRCSWCRRSCPTARRNDLRCVSIEHKLGIHASPTCVMSYGDEGGATGWLVGRGAWRHARDVHDDEQRAAQCRLAGRRHRRARDASARSPMRSSRQAGAAGRRAGRDRRPSRRAADAAADARADHGGAGAGLLRVRAGRPRHARRREAAAARPTC